MFPITVINNNVLKTTSSTEKSFKVEIQDSGGTWRDISDYVKEISIYENLLYNGSSQLNKIGIRLDNSNGEFSPAKVGAPFNPLVDNKPWLTHKFPIRVKAVVNGTPPSEYLLFQGYVNKISESAVDAVLEGYDLLFALSRRRLTRGFYAVYIDPETAIRNLLTQSGVLDDWAATFGTEPNLYFAPTPQANTINYHAEGGKTYFEALSELCNSLGSYFTYSAINNTLYINFPADASFVEPTANVTIATADCSEYTIKNQVDVPNRVVVEADLLEPYDSKINDYWTFQAKDIDSAIRLPKNSRSNLTISFNNKAYNPDLTNVYITFRTYTQEVVGSKLVYKAGGAIGRWYDLTAVPLTINDIGTGINVTIHDYEVKIDGIILDVKNNAANTNVAIVEVKVDAYPYIETGTTKQIFEEVDVIPNEKSLKTSYISQDVLQRLAEAYLKYLRSLYIVEADLISFRPDLFAGGVIKMTLYDTSLNDSVMILRSVKHNIRMGFWITTIQAGLIGSPALTATTSNDAGVSKTTLAPFQISEPTVTIIED